MLSGDFGVEYYQGITSKESRHHTQPDVIAELHVDTHSRRRIDVDVFQYDVRGLCEGDRIVRIDLTFVDGIFKSDMVLMVVVMKMMKS